MVDALSGKTRSIVISPTGITAKRSRYRRVGRYQSEGAAGVVDSAYSCFRVHHEGQASARHLLALVSMTRREHPKGILGSFIGAPCFLYNQGNGVKHLQRAFSS